MGHCIHWICAPTSCGIPACLLDCLVHEIWRPVQGDWMLLACQTIWIKFPRPVPQLILLWRIGQLTLLVWGCQLRTPVNLAHVMVIIVQHWISGETLITGHNVSHIALQLVLVGGATNNLGLTSFGIGTNLLFNCMGFIYNECTQ